MKTYVIYSSKTGNTKKIASQIFGAIAKYEAAELVSVDEIKSHHLEANRLAVGYWNDKGTADKMILDFAEKVTDKELILFGTQGADPESDHGKQCIENVNKLFSDSNILGHFLCQGRIDPELTKMFERLPADHPHAMDENRRKRHEQAASHPDQDDLSNAAAMIERIYKG